MSQNGCGTTTLNPQPLGGSDWAQLEAGTLRFRDPLNKDRRFIPLRLEDAPITGSLAQFLYANWLPQDCAQEQAGTLEPGQRWKCTFGPSKRELVEQRRQKRLT